MITKQEKRAKLYKSLEDLDDYNDYSFCIFDKVCQLIVSETGLDMSSFDVTIQEKNMLALHDSINQIIHDTALYENQKYEEYERVKNASGGSVVSIDNTPYIKVDEVPQVVSMENGRIYNITELYDF